MLSGKAEPKTDQEGEWRREWNARSGLRLGVGGHREVSSKGRAPNVEVNQRAQRVWLNLVLGLPYSDRGAGMPRSLQILRQRKSLISRCLGTVEAFFSGRLT